MKKLVAKVKSMNLANYLAAFAMIFTVTSANGVCICIFHDVEKPDLAKFRKF